MSLHTLRLLCLLFISIRIRLQWCILILQPVLWLVNVRLSVYSDMFTLYCLDRCMSGGVTYSFRSLDDCQNIWFALFQWPLLCSSSHLRVITDNKTACFMHFTVWGSASLPPSPFIRETWPVLAAKQAGCPGRLGPVLGYAHPLVHSCSSKKKERWNMTTWARFIFIQDKSL